METAFGVFFVFLMVFIPFSKTYNLDFIISDEGYLWYGVQQTLRGKIPIRDFRAYDPGRYYWCAFWCKLFGESLVTIRFSLKIFQFLALITFLIFISPRLEESIVAILALIVLFLWSGLIHKTIDNILPIFSVTFLLSVIDSGNAESFIIYGLFTGITLIIGLNHFAYHLFALLLLLLMYSNFEVSAAVYSIIGLSLGMAPFLFFLILTKTGRVYFDKKIIRILTRKTTNLKLPIPLPWNTFPKNSKKNSKIIALKWVFATLPVYLVLSITYILFVDSENLVFNAAIFMAIPYANHIYSRADKSHLIGGISPLLLSIFALFSINFYLFTFLLVLILIVTYYVIWMPDYYPLISRKHNLNTHEVSINNQKIRTSRSTSILIKNSLSLKERCNGKGQMVFLPKLAGLYAITKTIAPIYDTFSVYPPINKEENQMLSEFNKTDVQFCIVDNSKLDDKNSLRFQNTYPKIWKYLQTHFKRVSIEGMTSDFHIFARQ